MNNLTSDLNWLFRGFYPFRKITEKPSNIEDYLDVYYWNRRHVGMKPFESINLDWLDHQKGVYCLLDESEPDDQVFYIGQSKNIKKRIISHSRKKDSAFKRMMNNTDWLFEHIRGRAEKQRLIFLSGNINDERFYHKVIKDFGVWRALNDSTKLLKYD